MRKRLKSPKSSQRIHYSPLEFPTRSPVIRHLVPWCFLSSCAIYWPQPKLRTHLLKLRYLGHGRSACGSKLTGVGVQRDFQDGLRRAPGGELQNDPTSVQNMPGEAQEGALQCYDDPRFDLRVPALSKAKYESFFGALLACLGLSSAVLGCLGLSLGLSLDYRGLSWDSLRLSWYGAPCLMIGNS